MAFIRAVNIGDLDDLMELSNHVPRGMTNLPLTENKWADLVEQSELSFRNLSQNEMTKGTFLLVLVQNNKVIGTGALFSPVGFDRPFYNYRVTKYSNFSPDINQRLDGELLHLVNDYNGAAEVGTLFLHPKYRGGGRGSFLSYSRFMIIASYYDKFPELVMAEIRGWEADDGKMPFWEAVGSKFLDMCFDEADKLSAHDFRFIADLFPRIPIYTNLLPDDAVEAIAKPNIGAKGAYVMLSKLGFRYNGLVDIFDAGPCIDAPKSEISIIKNTHNVEVKIISDKEIQKFPRKDQAIISTKNEEKFITLLGYSKKDEVGLVYISEDQANEITLPSDEVLATRMDDIC